MTDYKFCPNCGRSRNLTDTPLCDCGFNFDKLKVEETLSETDAAAQSDLTLKSMQDDEWNRLTPAMQKITRDGYMNMIQNNATGIFTEYIQSQEQQYGKHNVCPSEYIKTWQNVLTSNWRTPTILPEKVAEKMNKMISSIEKIMKVIELGYGGVVTTEEMKSGKTYFTVTYSFEKGDYKITAEHGIVSFVAFHLREQAEEFLYNNRDLLDDFNML